MVLTSAFDAASNRTKLTSTIGGTADFENDYSYDNLLRLTRVDQIGQSGGNTVADKRVDFVYDVGSRLTSLARNYKSGGTWTEAASTAFAYDTIDRLTGIDHKRGGTSLFTAYSYSFDYANRITGNTSQDGTVSYTNDATNQLTGADYSYQTDETFSFDANGNWNMSGYTNGTNNKRSSDGTYNYTYDKEGNLILRVKISDSSRTEYTWDLRNRLTNITERATLGGAATKSIDYVYDAFNHRISKSVDADGAGAAVAVITRFVYDGTDVALQFDGSSNLVKRDLWAEAVGLIAEENASNATLWGLADNLGTVRDLIDNSGEVQNHLKYSAFDKITSETNSAIDFLMGARGMVRDEETNAHYAWHRYTINGQWLSEDPIGFSAGDPNLSRVTSNSPISLRDPSGLLEEFPTPREIPGLVDMSTMPGGYSGVIGNPNKYETPTEYTKRVYGTGNTSTFWQSAGNIAASGAMLAISPGSWLMGVEWGDAAIAVQHPVAYTTGGATGAFHGQTMVWNAATFHQVTPLNDYVNETIEQNGGVYSAANVAAHVGALAGEAAVAIIACDMYLAAPLYHYTTTQGAAGIGAGMINAPAWATSLPPSVVLNQYVGWLAQLYLAGRIGPLNGNLQHTGQWTTSFLVPNATYWPGALPFTFFSNVPVPPM